MNKTKYRQEHGTLCHHSTGVETEARDPGKWWRDFFVFSSGSLPRSLPALSAALGAEKIKSSGGRIGVYPHGTHLLAFWETGRE